MVDLSERAAALRLQYNDCFGCGLANPIGLHLDGFVAAHDELRASFTPRPEYCGFSGVLHGGILAALLDETLAWTAMLLEGTFVVTANLELKFRNPAPTAAAYEVHGKVMERRGRRLRLAGSVRTDEKIVADAAGLFVATDPVVP
jgi:acyl-coenzyme A thioesterase PaaI-like protein